MSATPQLYWINHTNQPAEPTRLAPSPTCEGCRHSPDEPHYCRQREEVTDAAGEA